MQKQDWICAQPEDVLSLCSNFKESMSIYAYKRYVCKKEGIAIWKYQAIHFEKL